MNPVYKWIIIVVVGVLFLSFAAEIVLAILYPNPVGIQQRVFDTVDWAFKMSLGAILGLIGGKVSELHQELGSAGN